MPIYVVIMLKHLLNINLCSDYLQFMLIYVVNLFKESKLNIKYGHTFMLKPVAIHAHLCGKIA